VSGEEFCTNLPKGSGLKVLLTGATGLVGGAILRQLAARGDDVRVMIRDTSPRNNLADMDPEIVFGDLNDRGSLDTACAGCEVLIHTAADYRLWAPDKEEMIRTNVQGSRNMMEAAGAAGISRIVYTSSVAALGFAGPWIEADETTPSEVDSKVGAYKKSKFLAEAEVLKMNAEEGLPVVIVNPSAPLGPGDIKPTPTGRLVVEAAKGKIPAYVNAGLNIVHVDDVATGHLLALEKGEDGQKYILGSENLTLKEILTMITQTAGKRPPIFQVPHGVALPVAYISELWAGLVTGKEPFTTVDGVKMSMKPMYFSSQKAITKLGYAPRPARDAIVDSVRWFAENGYLS
jgi:dihydroflavonol-4-reductase